MLGTTSGRWSRRRRLITATLLAMTVLVASDGVSGWWPLASRSPVVTEPAAGRPALTGVIYFWRGLLMQPARTTARNSNDGLLVAETVGRGRAGRPMT
jgi:hypothetical protein